MFLLLNCVGCLIFENLGFQIPPDKKSHVDKSGILAGHMMSPHLEITWVGNRLFPTALEAREVWHVAPSCWKMFSSLTGRRACGGAKKLSNM
jgi:hypothetical protein